jgi:hypothetical protein
MTRLLRLIGVANAAALASGVFLAAVLFPSLLAALVLLVLVIGLRS